MRADDRDGLRVYRFETLPDAVDALVTTRRDDLDLSSKVRDDHAPRLFRTYGLPDRAVWCKQVHSDVVAHVDAPQLVNGADALITNTPGLPLCVIMADCVPVLAYDPEHHALGLAHAGWQGTCARIASASVRAMTARFGTDPAAVIAAIGPSIGPEEYEVGEDVITRARDAYGSDAPILRELGGGKALFDLWAANELDLRSAGVTQIEVAGVSTARALDEFYSHRREPHVTGRFATVAVLAT
ncbi:peptidoglycan editing factor PgeF [Solirubrobacter sp. CPCC 204708]|uniref:Purine nucleoside phosphorylase n=1 Tax=Solirubrobacter deserti TaxID=2282478 RepID=A0ABT4RSX9_9ACTN|nr:peptidoglycan editing factor PgeF [Solirubrobacter deserti]MBE2320350.1 peptidoglycan editing factor PgeF [Solirubrobacter deserti]MDA0141702.1 peptidoglycan editing factor PgeF [Solirubrobacter deserti]